MKVTTGLLGLIARGWAGFTISGPADSAIEVPPVFLNAGEVPQPILRLNTAGVVGTPLNVTNFSSTGAALNASGSYACSILSEGLWEITWRHWNELSGAVIDLTASSDLTMSVAGLSGSPALSRIRDSGFEQDKSGSFRISVLKGQEVTFTHAISGGAGTSTASNRVSLLCSRLL